MGRWLHFGSLKFQGWNSETKNKVRKTPLYWLARKLFLTQKVGNSQRDIRHDFEYSISVIGELLHLKSFHKVKSFQLRPKLFSSLNESWEKIWFNRQSTKRSCWSSLEMHLSESILFQRIFHTPSKFMTASTTIFRVHKLKGSRRQHNLENNNPS